MTNKDEITMNSDKNAYFLSLPEITELSVPPKTILLEEGRIADKLFLIRKGCLRLFFNNEGQDITFQFFFEGDFVASFDSLYKRTPSLFSLESIEPAELSVMKREDFFRNLGQKPVLRQTGCGTWDAAMFCTMWRQAVSNEGHAGFSRRRRDFAGSGTG